MPSPFDSMEFTATEFVHLSVPKTASPKHVEQVKRVFRAGFIACFGIVTNRPRTESDEQTLALLTSLKDEIGAYIDRRVSELNPDQN